MKIPCGKARKRFMMAAWNKTPGKTGEMPERRLRKGRPRLRKAHSPAAFNESEPPGPSLLEPGEPHQQQRNAVPPVSLSVDDLHPAVIAREGDFITCAGAPGSAI